MFNLEAIEAIQLSHAIDAAHEAVAGSQYGLAALPATYTVHDLEKWMPVRRRQRGRMSTTALDDFARYLQAHQEPGATVFVDAGRMEARAVLNLGTPSAPGHCDHSATFAPQKTAAFIWLEAKANGQPRTQRDIAEWAEDWADIITFLRDGAVIEAKHAVATIRKITIESLNKATTEQQSLSAERSTFEAVRATSGTDPLPTHLRVKCVPYLGLSERTFDLRVGINTGDAKAPALVLRIAAAERHTEEMGVELANLVREAVGDTPVVLGTFAAA